MQTRKWTNQQGQDQYTTEIVLQGFLRVMQMLDGKSSAGQSGGFQQPQAGGFQQQPQQAPAQHQPQHAPAQHQPQHAPAQHQPQHAPAHHQPQRAPAPQRGYAPKPQPAQQAGYQPQQAPKVNPAEPSIDFDDDIPF